MFYNLPTNRWSLKMIFDNFQDYLYQGLVEREAEERSKTECTECEKDHEEDVSCSEAGAVRLNV